MDVCIVYPSDPLGVSPGGIDSFIRGVLRWAPEDLRMSLIGVTTDTTSRPLNKWTTCRLGDRTFEFYPIVQFERSERQAKFPLTIRFVAALYKVRRSVSADLLEFHRIEPCIPFLGHKTPMTVVLHQNMSVLRNRDSDIRWKYLPRLYYLIEKYTLRRVQTVFCVRENAVLDYQRKFPESHDKFRFTPTWFDPEVFSPPTDSRRDALRASIFDELDISRDSRLLIWVGRLDRQKNPQLLIDAFHRLHSSHPHVRLLLVGDGVLRDEVEERVDCLDLIDAVILTGVKPAATIARYLQASDMFVLPSAYEGMPICILEALGCGLPVVATDVGEISRVVHSGVNGELVAEHTPECVSDAMGKCLQKIHRYRGDASYSSVKDFTPQKVLIPIYENYRQLIRSAG